MMQFKQIQTQQTYPLRQRVLRPNRPLSACQFPTDDAQMTYHFGLVDEQEVIVAIVTFLETEKGHQLRGMACNPTFQNQGLGSKLLTHAYDHLQAEGITKIWCQARIRAKSFYERLGFIGEGETFEVPDVGEHLEMYWTTAPEKVKK
ncbi:MAG: GNAT family N-acetyltransferase [Culicoidibacterales bacterium]